MKRDCAVIVFAKAPVPGQVKTRLARSIGDDRAALLAARMLTETVRRAVDSAIGDVELCCAPDATHPAFFGLHDEYGVTLTEQGSGDLGMRMQRALLRALRDHASAVLIGTDAPQLGVETLRKATCLLQSQPVVFAPASDGGYVLVGLTTPMPGLFDDIDWSTDRVMAQTRERLARLNIISTDLPTFHDVDEPADLEHVPEEWWK